MSSLREAASLRGGDSGVARLPLLLALLTLALMAVSLALGSTVLPFGEAIAQAFSDPSGPLATILVEIRIPRALIAALVGASLGLAGAVMQGLLRNALADPGLIGSASGAAFGAVAVLYFGLMPLGAMTLPLGGIAGALLATWVVWLLAGREGDSNTLILAGLAVNAFALALVSLLLNLAPSPYAAHEMVLWMLGSIANRSLPDLVLLLPGTLLGWGLLLGSGPALDALTLGEETARSLGVELERLRARLFLGIALTVGSAVAITGAIAFVGLVAPHVLRPLVGHQPGRLLGVSALGGAALLLAADILVRLIPATTELKVGVLTSLVGAPFFVWLILRSERG
jgi:iron complex transport system permease protein